MRALPSPDVSGRQRRHHDASQSAANDAREPSSSVVHKVVGHLSGDTRAKAARGGHSEYRRMDSEGIDWHFRTAESDGRKVAAPFGSVSQ
jgi:hypothetical protein